MTQVVKHDGWFGEGQLAFLFTLFYNETTGGHSFNWGNQKAAHSKQVKGNFTTCNKFDTGARDNQGRLPKQLTICLQISIALCNLNR